jgi:hypothetical protein
MQITTVNLVLFCWLMINATRLYSILPDTTTIVAPVKSLIAIYAKNIDAQTRETVAESLVAMTMQSVIAIT